MYFYILPVGGTPLSPIDNEVMLVHGDFGL